MDSFVISYQAARTKRIETAAGGGRWQMAKLRLVLGVGCDLPRSAKIRALLESLGCRIVMATTLAGALAACAAWSFDLIVIDRSVPASVVRDLVLRLGERIARARICVLPASGDWDSQPNSAPPGRRPEIFRLKVLLALGLFGVLMAVVLAAHAG